VLDALDRKDEPQAFRWRFFESTLVSKYLRDFLKRLPDLVDIEAEERAMDHAAAHPSLLPAIGFFLEWPSLEPAARLMICRDQEINGDRYEFLVPAAEALSEQFPLAATLALRAMMDLSRFGAAPLIAYCALKETNYGTNTDG